MIKSTCSWLPALIFLAAAIGNASADEHATLQVTRHQQEALQQVVTEVERKAIDYLDRNGKIAWQNIRALMTVYDEQVRAILSEDQWRGYDTQHRNFIAQQIHAGVISQRGPYVLTTPIPAGPMTEFDI